MGGGGATSGGTYVETQRRSLKPKGKPNSRCDLYRNGEKKQSRWYDHEGKAIRNRDYFHQNPKGNIQFPNDHTWKWENGKPQRIKENLEPDYEKFR